MCYDSLFPSLNLGGGIEMTGTVEVVMLPDGRMDRKNAARYLGLQPKTLAMHASRGTGPHFVKRGRVFYFKEDLDAWIQSGRVASTAKAAANTRAA
jgi:hypothetical protein